MWDLSLSFLFVFFLSLFLLSLFLSFLSFFLSLFLSFFLRFSFFLSFLVLLPSDNYGILRYYSLYSCIKKIYICIEKNIKSTFDKLIYIYIFLSCILYEFVKFCNVLQKGYLT